ncbi:MAG TPA: hypothetical protein PLV92_23500, partial [Pirellulaceae bacterium]|nr:hypothetical protein [Pirellulaceae bacterium]
MRNLFDILISGSIRRPALWLASVAFLAGFGSSLARAGDVKLNGPLFKIPDGFTIELIAGPPLVDRPITCDFDDQGRMYVSDSSGSNDKVDKQVVERPHRILRLEDVD